MDEIYNFVKNPTIPSFFLKFPGTYHHQVLFDHPINLNDGNLIGVICQNCHAQTIDYKIFEKLDKPTDKQFREIKQIIKDKPYKNIKIFTNNSPLPKLSDLI